MRRAAEYVSAAMFLGVLAVTGPAFAQDVSGVTDAARYTARRERAYARLGNDLLVVRSSWAPAHYTQPAFEQDPSFYYFTGADHLLGAILVLDGKTRRSELFLPSALPAFLGPVADNQGKPTPARDAAWHVDAVADWNQFSRYIARRLADDPKLSIRVDGGDFALEGLRGWVGIPLDSTAAPGRSRSVWTDALRQRWPDATFVPSRATISMELRAVKDSVEIATLRRVAANSAAALRAGLLRFAPGRRQRVVEAAVVETCTATGDGPSFWPLALSGPNSVLTPIVLSVDMHNLDRVMRAGEIAHLDIGCQVDHYMGDVGRTVPVSGTFTAGQAEVVDLLLATYRAGLAVLRDGVADTALIHASVAEAARLRPTMRTALGRHAAAVIADRDSIPYWQVHGVGLDVAENLPAVLRAGMVLDYEPIFAVDGQGFYMEDMILVTATGYEILTKGLPNTAAEIERAMRRPAKR